MLAETCTGIKRDHFDIRNVRICRPYSVRIFNSPQMQLAIRSFARSLATMDGDSTRIDMAELTDAQIAPWEQRCLSTVSDTQLCMVEVPDDNSRVVLIQTVAFAYTHDKCTAIRTQRSVGLQRGFPPLYVCRAPTDPDVLPPCHSLKLQVTHGVQRCLGMSVTSSETPQYNTRAVRLPEPQNKRLCLLMWH